MSGRNVGIDVARALAIFGMVIVNYKVVMNAVDGNALLLFMSRLCEGRASALFVVLAGMGLSFSTNKKRLSLDANEINKARRFIVVRGLLLIIIGLLYTLIWPADILHFYGVFFLLAALLLTLKDRQLLISALLTIIIFPCLMILLDYGRDWDWDTLTYQNLWTVEGMVRHIIFNGFHPLFPWFAFLLTGMWLGRQNLSDLRLRKRLLFLSAGIVLSVEGMLFISRVIVAGRAMFGLTLEDTHALLSSEMIPPLPQYMLVATSSAILVIIACLYVSEKLPRNKIITYLSATGKMALTLYIAHVVIGMGFLSLIGKLTQQSIGFSLFSSSCFFVLSIIFSSVWFRYFTLGPLEWLFRALSDRFLTTP